MTSETLAGAERKMLRAVEAMERDFQGLRTGRASTSLVERLTVDYYGTQTPLNQLASISVPESHQIVIQPWDRGVIGAIEKAIQKSDIGLTPNVDGTLVRLNIPPLTEERRKDIVKSVHKRMEEARVEIRNLRREAADAHQEGGAGRRGRDRRVPARAGPAPEAHGPGDRRRRSPGGRQGAGGPGGLVAQAPLDRSLARPTDAPPLAHEGRRAAPATPSADAAAVVDAPPQPPDHRGRRDRRRAAAARGAAAPRGDHHGRQPPLGARPRQAGLRGPRGRRRGDPRAAAARRAARRADADPVRVQPRELGPLRRGGRRPVRAAGPGDPRRDRRAGRAGREGPPPRPARGAAGLHADARSAPRSTGPPRAPGSSSTSPGTTRAAPRSSTPSAGSPRPGRRPTRSTSGRSARRCTRAACPTPTS